MQAEAWNLPPPSPTDAARSLGADVLELTSLETRSVRDAFASLPTLTHPDDVDGELLTRAELLLRSLPERLVEALVRFRREPNRAGTLILRNLPIDPSLPATPADGRSPRDKATSFSEYSLLVPMLALGEPLSYLDEKEGALIQNICPVKGHEAKQENTGSAYLEFHVEDGFHPHKPDYLGLVCLRSDHEGQAKTVTASVQNVLARLPTQAMLLLRQPLFRLRLSSSFGASGETAYCAPLPVLSGHWLEPDLCIDHFLMEATTPAADWAFTLLKRLLLGAVVEHALEPGDVLIVDNRRAVHGRTAFRPRYDGSDRWLQRMFAVRDLRRSGASRGLGSRQCVPLAVEFGVQA